MNKYEKKLYKIAPKGATIYELTREDIASKTEGTLDFFLGGLLRFGKSLKFVKSVGAFFLVINGEHVELFHIKPSLEVNKQNLTGRLQPSKNRKSFDYNGYRYTLFRKKHKISSTL